MLRIIFQTLVSSLQTVQAVHPCGDNIFHSSIVSSLLVLIAGTMVGIMFSMVAIESGSVWNSGIVHSLWNILIIGGGLSISEKADEYSVMTYVLDSKDVVFTGGEFGIESSIIALLGYVIVTLAAICMIKKKSKSVISIKKQNPVCITGIYQKMRNS